MEAWLPQSSLGPNSPSPSSMHRLYHTMLTLELYDMTISPSLADQIS